MSLRWKKSDAGVQRSTRVSSKHGVEQPCENHRPVATAVGATESNNFSAPEADRAYFPLHMSSSNTNTPRNFALRSLQDMSTNKENESFPICSRKSSKKHRDRHTPKNSSSNKKHKRTASLTDLRPEDKKKVANLIQELANLGSEKEKIETCLKKERESFEDAIKDLVSDQKSLLTERQSVQKELHLCQQMLNQLQEAVLHRPTSSAVSSQRNVDNDCGIAHDGSSKVNDVSRHSALEAYINRHNYTQEMDAASDVGSVVSDAIKTPR